MIDIERSIIKVIIDMKLNNITPSTYELVAFFDTFSSLPLHQMVRSGLLEYNDREGYSVTTKGLKMLCITWLT
jgi:Mn-dependent DtxR family transcriptional regulator